MPYFDDHGNEVDPDLIPKPPLCIACSKNEINDGEEDILCNLNRLDQAGSGEFVCGAFVDQKIQNGSRASGGDLHERA